MRFLPWSVLSAVACLSFTPGIAITQAIDLLVRLGSDTIAIEHFTRSPTTFEGELLRRIPASHVVRYSGTLNTAGLVEEFRFEVVRPGATTPQPGAVRSGRVIFGRDSATIELQRDTLQRRTVAASRGFPSLPESYALYQLWLGHFRQQAADSLSITTVAPLGGASGKVRLAARGADSVVVPIFGALVRIQADTTGGLIGINTHETPIKDNIDRISPVAILPLAEHFAAREAISGPLGPWLSPRDTVAVRLGDATVWVDYGRPAVRGRDVFGRGVLGDTLWRTGANAATQFRTDRDLLIGGARVPAGMYTLWTHYIDGTASLIINSQTGQWGTQYNGARDLARVPLRVNHGSSTQHDLFTIEVRSGADPRSGELRLMWDYTVLAVDIEVVAPG